ncbi:MAG: STAS/SEC14 domain-containing protein [Sphingomonadales bacterium]|nr:MAG: STAS/SEC14 domain-containing protein [Sphingomonadales bacterium]
MYRFDFDPVSGILAIVQNGFMSEENFCQYDDDFRREIVAARRHNPNVRLLVDAVDMAVLPQAVVERMISTSYLLRDGDCVAIVVQSTLLKRQATRIAESNGAEVEVFVTMQSARNWLLGDAALNIADKRAIALGKRAIALGRRAIALGRRVRPAPSPASAA